MHQNVLQNNWNPFATLIDNGIGTNQWQNSNYAVIILNTAIKLTPNFLLPLWNYAKFRMTVDGGTDQWLAWLKLNNIDLKTVPVPDRITGDMDSISQEALNNFIEKRILIVETPNQNETDFTKALRQLNECFSSCDSKVEEIYVIVDSSGRMDQIMANINTLYYAKGIVPYAKVYQLASDSLSWLLNEGSHSINIPLVLQKNKEWCALIPIGEPCILTTSGLKWNLRDDTLKFGQLVSTSNTYEDSSEVIVRTNSTVLWIMGTESLLNNILTKC